MILAELASHYGRLVETDPEIAPYGFEPIGFHYGVVLNADGDVVDVDSLIDMENPKRPRPKFMNVPAVQRTGTAARPRFLCDKAEYALGVGGKKPDVAHTEFRKHNKALLKGTDEPGLLAFLRFLDKWNPDDHQGLRYAEDIFENNRNVVFRLDGVLGCIHESSDAVARWARHWETNEDADVVGQCLVTGKRGPVAKTHPKVRGVRGGQGSGTSLVSFNFRSADSYGKSQSANSPVSPRAAFAYTTAMNSLLRGKRIVNMGGATTIFWARSANNADAEAAEDAIWSMTSPPDDKGENAILKGFFRRVATGAPRPEDELPLDLAKDTVFHVLGVSPNAGRLSVRFWWQGEVREIVERIAQHWLDLRLLPVRDGAMPPKPLRLLAQTAVLGKEKNIQPTLEGGLMRAIFKGERYPAAMLTETLARIRTEDKHSGVNHTRPSGMAAKVNHTRASICKACIARDHRLGFAKEEVPVSLDENNPNTAYQLGRLFAILVKVQHDAIGQSNSTIKDRYYGSASSAPAMVFHTLVSGAMKAHLPTLRKDKYGLAVVRERRIGEIMDRIGIEFPKTLGPQDQGRFAVGYFHEDAYLWTKRKDDDLAAGDEEPAA